MTDCAIRIHLGAHKTATTYLQDLLDHNRAALAARGVAYWPRKNARDPLQSSFRADAVGGARSRLISRFAENTSRNHATRRLAELFSPPMAVLVSEENILGATNDCTASGFYPKAGQRLSVLRDALPDNRPVELFVAIRSYADFLASIYAESLRHGGFHSLANLKADGASPGGEWPALADTIRSMFPDAPLVVWRYEAFRVLEPAILDRLTGGNGESLQRPDRPDAKPSASAEAIERMIEEAPALGPSERIFRMLALEYEYPAVPGGRRFDPWTGEQRAAMDTAYRRDLTRLAARDDIELLA